jgi:hypothetical protein
MTLEKYKKYQGIVNLPGLVERNYANSTVADKFRSYGFTNVQAEHLKGDKTQRIVSGVWSKETENIDLASLPGGNKITSITEI